MRQLKERLVGPACLGQRGACLWAALGLQQPTPHPGQCLPAVQLRSTWHTGC